MLHRPKFIMSMACIWKVAFALALLLSIWTNTSFAQRRYKALQTVKSFVSSTDQAKAVESLIQRFIGKRADEVQVKVVSNLGAQQEDYAYLESSDNLLKITGTSGVAVAFGFNQYLKYYCKKHISWAGDQLSDLPNPLPSVPSSGVLIKAGVKYRYYQNVCTVSYSSVWWNWTRWEREIDWMALNGINLPLAFTGQEAIWQRVYNKLGFSNQDLDEHFTGPAFLAWGRMGNLEKWGGPLPASWKESQLQLQHIILTRMRSLGMIPVLPGFAGHVPAAVTKLFPSAQVSQLSHWSHFNCTYSCTTLLEPDDPLFNTIGGMFIEEQMKEYNGTNHIYNADTFNEMTPRSDNVSYLAGASRAVFNAMTLKDPEAIWLMQGWLFHNEPTFWKNPQIKALLTAVPQGRLLILDLFSESYPQYDRTDFYYGQPFIWCMLHNFGGNLGFYGKMDVINNSPYQALTSTNSSMVGTGITPEGINQNYMIYEFMLEHGFTVRSANITDWITKYVQRRYNSNNTDIIATWLLLGSTIYNDTSAGFPEKTQIRGTIVKRPSAKVAPLPYWYDRSSLAMAWDRFAKSLDNLEAIETVAYDAVDITRQMLQLIHTTIFDALVQEYEWKFPAGVDHLSDLMLDLLNDFDRILSTNSHFMMGSWIRDARAMGTTDEEKDLYEFNARNQVTLWGPNGEIVDYADKHWASLAMHYYRPRWALFISYIKQALADKKMFNDAAFVKDVFTNVEEPFTKSKATYPYQPKEHAVQVAKELYEKWRKYLTMR